MAATIIKNGRIHDAVHREAYVADILLADGKIAAIGSGLTVPADAAVFDADGLEVYPGFVDAHTHIGLDGYGIGYEGCDYNEMNDIWTPQLRAIDGINPRDPSLADARRAGVTCVCTGPGSANVLGGTFLAMKTVGDRVDKMVVRDPVAMKCAFGENPKRCYRDKCDSTRMSTAAFLRGALMQARDYGARKQAANGDITKMPAYNQKLEALLPVLAREIPLKAHAHQANDIFTALRIAREFNLRLTLEHVTEGHLIVDELAGENFGNSLDAYRSRLVIWSASMEKPVRVDKVCSSIDILPTMLNLMEADYDSRLIIGRDILSDSTGLVLFPDRSFITDAFEYNAVTDTLTSHTGAEISDDSFSAMQLYVADKFTAADNITESGYYTYVARYLGIDEDN